VLIAIDDRCPTLGDYSDGWLLSALTNALFEMVLHVVLLLSPGRVYMHSGGAPIASEARA
jgi:hypothetical protein